MTGALLLVVFVAALPAIVLAAIHESRRLDGEHQALLERAAK